MRKALRTGFVVSGLGAAVLLFFGIALLTRSKATPYSIGAGFALAAYGTATLAVLGRSFRHAMSRRVPVLMAVALGFSWVVGSFDHGRVSGLEALSMVPVLCVLMLHSWATCSALRVEPGEPPAVPGFSEAVVSPSQPTSVVTKAPKLFVAVGAFAGLAAFLFWFVGVLFETVVESPTGGFLVSRAPRSRAASWRFCCARSRFERSRCRPWSPGTV